LNSVARILGRFESDNAGALGTASCVGVNVGTDHSTLLGCYGIQTLVWIGNIADRRLPRNGFALTSLAEQILQVLPTDIEGELIQDCQYL
jgi:hypothetical protein